jgi:hemerythrin
MGRFLAPLLESWVKVRSRWVKSPDHRLPLLPGSTDRRQFLRRFGYRATIPLEARHAMDELSKLLVKWDKSYATGIQSIDSQHQVLIGMIAKFQKGMLEGRTREQLPGLLDNLITYAEYHFRWEEQMLEQKQYPELEKHRKGHQVLTDQIRDFERRFEAGKVVAGASVMLFLRHWFTDHILETDFRYAKYFEAEKIVPDSTNVSS